MRLVIPAGNEGEGRNKDILCACLALLFCFVTLPLRAESLEVLALKADAIAVILPAKKVSYWEEKVIRTRATLQVRQVIAGRIETKTINVVYDGGVVGKIGLVVSHGVRLPVGQKSILFLKRTGKDFTVVNQQKGVFFVFPGTNGEVVVPAEAVHLPPPGLRVKSSRVTPPVGTGVPLNTFIATLQEFRR